MMNGKSRDSRTEIHGRQIHNNYQETLRSIYERRHFLKYGVASDAKYNRKLYNIRSEKYH